MIVAASARRLSSVLPAGSLSIGLGLALFGLTSYGYLFVTARVLDPAAFAAVSALWVVLYTGGPGLFLPFEQALGKMFAQRAGAAQIRTTVRLAGGILLVTLLVAMAASRWIVRQLFDGSMTLFVAMLLGLAGMWTAYLSRGVLAGTAQFGAYGRQLGIEGLVRFLSCLLIAIAGWGGVNRYALVLGLSVWVGVAVTTPELRGAMPTGVAPEPSRPSGSSRRPGGSRVAARTLYWMCLGGLCSQVLVNAGPVLVKADPGAAAGSAGHFLAGLMLARAPLFVFAAVQAALLPGLARLAMPSRATQFRSQVGRLVLAVVVVMSAATAGIALIGPMLLPILFGAGFGLPTRDLGLLTAGTGLFIAASVVWNAVIAVGAVAGAAVCWLLGVVALAAFMFVPVSLFTKVELGYDAGSLAALVALILVLRHALRGWPRRSIPAIVGGPA